MKKWVFPFLFLAACTRAPVETPLTMIQIQDRNGITETINSQNRLAAYMAADFLSSQPYKKVLRVYKADGKTYSKITTYHPNGSLFQYLEAEEMRAYGTYQEWFANGQIKIDAKVIGGTADVGLGVQKDWIFDGVCHVWDEKGTRVAQIPYVKGVLEGTSLYYFSDERLQREAPFVKNNLEGDLTEYYPNGLLRLKCHYQKGAKVGKSLSYFEGGEVAKDEEYVDGLLLKGKYYKENGDLISEVENGGGFQADFEDGMLTLVEFRMGNPEGAVRKYTRSNDLIRSFRIKSGKKQGEEVEYYLPQELEIANSNGQPKMSLEWSENAIHGSVKTWYNNGQLQSQRDYSKNQKTGPSLAWYKNGSLMLLEEYENDQLVSGQYYKINRQDPVSSISNGTGVATLYDEGGVFLKKITYSKGKAVDPES